VDESETSSLSQKSHRSGIASVVPRAMYRQKLGTAIQHALHHPAPPIHYLEGKKNLDINLRTNNFAYTCSLHAACLAGLGKSPLRALSVCLDYSGHLTHDSTGLPGACVPSHSTAAEKGSRARGRRCGAAARFWPSARLCRPCLVAGEIVQASWALSVGVWLHCENLP
jgi:hypothetical protein